MIGKRIEELRKGKGWTQAQLAEKADITRTQISRYEHDKQDPDFSTVVRLAKALEVSVNSILSGPEADKVVTEEDIRFALSGGGEIITPAQYQEILNFAHYIQERDRNNGTK